MPASRLLLLATSVATAHACTNMIVSRGATSDMSTHVAYNADSGSLYGSLGHYPAKDHSEGARRQIWDWDGSFYLGSIPEVKHTYNVVGNINEHALTIGETTFGGRRELNGGGTGAIMDYGSLIWVTLQRAKTAREAIHVIDGLMQTYGYASEGESFSIADPDEAWLMELIGKGNETGAVWVASRVPEGSICSHANQARTRHVKWDDPETVLYSKDVMTFAQKKGYFPKDGKAEDFSFVGAYDPISFTGARFCEARVWNIYRKFNKQIESHMDYAQGFNLSNPMPLFIKVDKKLSVNDTMNAMRTHFEGTWFDNRGLPGDRPDVGAGPGNSAYRWRPLTWKSGGKTYLNERTVGVQQTAWNFVSQMRSGLPLPIAGLFWFAPDDSATAVRIPVYGGVTAVPLSFADPVGQEPAAAVEGAPAADAYTMRMDSAFWVWNMVANLAYGERYSDVYPLVQRHIAAFQNEFFKSTERIDAEASKLYTTDPKAAIRLITNFTVTEGDRMTKEWLKVWMKLFATTRDGFYFKPDTKKLCKPGQLTECTSKLTPDAGPATSGDNSGGGGQGYSPEWYARIVKESGKHFEVPTDLDEAAVQRKLSVMDKSRRRPHAF